MTKELQTIKVNGKEIPVIDSREVAEMVGKTHYELLKHLEGQYTKNGKVKIVGIIPTLLKGETPLSDYFIEDSYKDASGKANKCYLCTKMGCELIGNKQQGEKGILFSARYVERFNQYEEALKEMQQPKQMSDMEILSRAVLISQEQIKHLTAELKEKQEFIDDINDCFTFTQIAQFNKHLLKDRKDIVLSTATLNRVAAELNIPINKIDNPIVYSPYRRVNAYPRKVWMTAYPDIKFPNKECK